MYFHWIFELIFELILLNSKKKNIFIRYLCILYNGFWYNILYMNHKLWIQWNLETLNDENNIDKIIDSWSDESTALLKCQLIF